MKYSVIYSASLFCSLLAAAHSTTSPSHGKRFQKKRAIIPGLGDDNNDNGLGGFNPDIHIPPVFPITLPNGVVIGGPSSSSPTSTSTTTSSSSASEVTVTSEVTSTVTVTSNTDGPSSGPTSSRPASTSDITSVLPATSTSLPADPTDTPSGSPSSSVPTATSSSSSGGGILDPITSLISSILDPPPPTSSTPTATADPTGPSSAPGSTVTPPPSTSSSSTGGILDPITSLISSVLDPPPPSSSPSATPSGPTSEPSSQPPSSEPTNPPTQSPDGPSSVPSSVPPSSSPSDGPSSLPSSTPSVTISFPSSAPSSSATDSVSASITDAPTVTATTTISVNSDLSFVLTETTLAFTSVPTTTATTLSDPDGNPTSAADSEPTPATTLAVAALPTGIPARIYPKNTLDLKSIDTKEYTLISVLFNQALNWQFVVTSPISSSQIFAYMPNIISNALGIDGTQVQTFALQVYIPSTYKSPADAAQLGTMFLAFIPADRVNDLAALIKARSSIFYTGLNDPVAKALAEHVNPGFSVKTVSNPNGSSNNPGVGAADGSASSGGSNKSRQDAIIGVVSALGAIALLVLGFLVYRSVQRKREMAHRRLSDPPEMTEEERDRMGYRPDGREFDRDSLGGQRRRSFYFAEDSLRGWEYQQQQQQQMAQQQGQGASYSYLQDREGAQGMSRRNVGPVLVPGAISAPILRENTMNW